MYRFSKESLVLLLLGTILGIFSEYSWITELFSHFELQYFIGSLVLTICFYYFKKKTNLIISIILLVYHTAIIVPFFKGYSLGVDSGENNYKAKVTLVQFNVHMDNPNLDEITKWLSGNNFDVVILQEVKPAFAEKLESIKDIYPYQLITPRNDSFGSAIISRKKLISAETPSLSDGWNHYIKSAILLDDGTILDLYGIHTLPPMSASGAKTRNTQLSEVANAVRKDSSTTKIMIGDFNLTPYSPYYKNLLHATGLKNSMNGYGLQNSWPSMFPMYILRIPIDHILVSENIEVIERKIGPNIGSDHFSVIAKLGIK